MLLFHPPGSSFGLQPWDFPTTVPLNSLGRWGTLMSPWSRSTVLYTRKIRTNNGNVGGMALGLERTKLGKWVVWGPLITHNNVFLKYNLQWLGPSCFFSKPLSAYRTRGDLVESLYLVQFICSRLQLWKGYITYKACIPLEYYSLHSYKTSISEE